MTRPWSAGGSTRSRIIIRDIALATRRSCGNTPRSPARPSRVLDIGGGQHALLAKRLWGDRATLADIAGSHFDYLRQQGVEVVEWNLCSNMQPFVSEFDAIFFSEVIEHLPIPGHVVLERLRIALKPGGVLICTTPNLYRLRNVVYLALGKQMYDYFRMPTDRGLGHILEYSQDHLRWQFERAGFEGVHVELCHLAHTIKATSFPRPLLVRISLVAVPPLP